VQKAIHQSADHTTNQGSDPEQPQLFHGPGALEEGHAGRTGRVHGGVGDGDADQVNQGQGQTNRHACQASVTTLVGCAHDDEQEEGGQHNFCDQGCVAAVVVGRVLAKAVGGETCHGIEAGFAAGDQVQNTAGQQTADNLGNDVGNGITSGEASPS